MKPNLPLLAATITIVLLLAFRIHENSNELTLASGRQDYQKRNIINCSPNWNELKAWIEEVDIPPMPGSGNLKWPIATTNDSAQFYFNQGINTYYGFHIIEAMASFKKAAKLDSLSPMIYWAQALAYGPNINDVGYSASPDALYAVKKAMELSSRSEPKEKMLIEAQQVRYSADSTISRQILNQRYADKMKEAYEKFPGDANIAALYADALMLQHPWDLWNVNGTPKQWTPEIRGILEKLLASHPDHPGANHYYIHVMEPSPFAAKAKASADRLGDLTPGLSHLVHMPSHIYLRTGDYHKGARVNENAINSYKRSLQLYAPVAGNDFLYIIHNLHMQTNHAMMEGDSAYSTRSAGETAKSIPADYLAMPGPLGNYMQYIYMTPVLVHVRFGNWNALLSMQQPGKTQVYANVLYHFGRGMARAHTLQHNEARHELAMMKQLMKDSSLKVPMIPFSAVIEGCTVAENLLTGSIALSEKKYTDAITAFSKAVMTEDSMVYTEPRDWMLSPKHYLGQAYLQAGKFALARQVFQNDLDYNNENGWALFGLYKALLLEKKKAAAQQTLNRFKKAFSKADIILQHPVQL